MIMIVCSLLLFIYYWTYRYCDDYAKSDLVNDSCIIQYNWIKGDSTCERVNVE